MIMRCIAIDDEPLALTQMSKYIERTAFLELAGVFRNAAEASRWLAKYDVDLVFADINMPGTNGIELVRSLRKEMLVIFTTAHSEYALDGFRVNAIDYLLKPIGYADFLQSAEKAWRQFCLLAGSQKAEDPHHTIFVKSAYKVIPVNLEDILYIESRSEYVRIFTENHRPLMTLGSLKSYEDKLPSESFMRVHRSYIVNLHKISAVERKHILLSKGISIPVSDSYDERFRKFLDVDKKFL